MVGFSKIARDLTERKRAEERIRKLNRVYAVLSYINQAIVRIREPQELFEKACHIAVEKGKFPLVWIGLLDDSTKELRVVASAGKADGYLEKINISLKDKPRSYCPIDSALREGKHVICNVIGQDEDLAPCQKIAFELGFRSSASSPLQVFGRIRGTVNFYADEPHFFDEEEIKLLDELAMDISFAMEFAEKEVERKQAGEYLAQSEANLRAVFEGARDGILAADAQTKRFVFANEAICRMLGYGYNEMLNLGVEDIHPAEDLLRVQEQIERQVKGEILLAADIPVKRKDGSVFYADINSTTAELGGRPCLIGVFRDITERKRAEEELRGEKNFIEDALNSLSDIFFVFDLNGKFLRWNKTTNAVSGYSDAEISSMQPADFFLKEDKQRVIEAIETVVKYRLCHC